MTSLINVEAVLDTMAEEIKAVMAQRGVSDPVLVGIRTGGVWLAEYLL